MQTDEFICPYCMVSAPVSILENVGSGKVKCRRCRSVFRDPDAYDPDVVYADCDSTRPVTVFPFSLRGKTVSIRVRDGYLAFLAGPYGESQWIEESGSHIAGGLDGYRLIYVCLFPRVLWGTGTPGGFGAYGTAQLSLSADYVMRFCKAGNRIQDLEENLKQAVNRYIRKIIQTETDRDGVHAVENRNAYAGITGVIKEGVSLVRTDPLGYRGPNGAAGSFPVQTAPAVKDDAADTVSLYRPPVEIIKPPRFSYIIRDGVEEVFCSGKSATTRHKAGETVDQNLLRDVDTVIRYRTKEFEFPFGWGIYNQPRAGQGYYSAQGTISFYIDETEKFSRLLCSAGKWRDFEEQFFTNVLKKRLAESLGEIMDERLGSRNPGSGRIEQMLSAMSVDLTNRFNGEDASGKEPAFRKYGLRVRQTDIFGIRFYPDRR